MLESIRHDDAWLIRALDPANPALPRRRLGKSAFWAALICVIGSFSAPGATLARDANVKVSVDQSRQFQTMEGFGAEPAQWFGGRACPMADTVPATDKKKILDLLYSDLGLTGARTYIEFHGPGGDFDKFQKLAPILSEAEQRARENDDSFHLVIGGFVSWDFRDPSGHVQADGAIKYANWAAGGLLRLAKEGIAVQYWDIAPEPDGAGKLSVRDLAELIVATGAAFRRAGITTRIAAPRTYTVADAPEYAIPLLRDSTTRQYIQQLDFHEYDYDASEGQHPDIPDRRLIAKLARHYHLTVAMRETSSDVKRHRTTFWNGTYDQAMAWVNDVMTDVVDADASAWDLIAADYIRNNPRYGVDSYLVLKFTNCTYSGFEIPPHYWTLRQFVKFVRPGATRVAARSSSRQVRVAAFGDPKRNETILVIINNSRKRAASIQVNGVAGGSVTETLTTATEHGAIVPAAPVQKNRPAAILPPKSVATFVFKQ
jgi:O-glycosyl hydrolase